MALRPLNLIACSKCGMRILPHRVCWNCGYYKGKQEIDVLAKLDKKERKKREKVLRQQEEAAEAQKKV